MPELPGANPGSLYVHVPFCRSLCPFCSFHRTTYCPQQAARYFKCVRAELELYAREGFHFDRLYCGGGTPTVAPAELVRTIRLARHLFGMRKVSVETNASDLTPTTIEMLEGAGVTRLSIGVQTFNDVLLKRLGRLEPYGTGAAAQTSVAAAARTFRTVNVDLIFDQPGQTVEDLANDVECVLESGANELSLYPLMRTGPTPSKTLSQWLLDEERLASLYAELLSLVGGHFRPLTPWTFGRTTSTEDEYVCSSEFYVGLGTGAFSQVGRWYYASTFSLDAYEGMIRAGKTGIATGAHWTQRQEMTCALLMNVFGLQVQPASLQGRFGGGFFANVAPEFLALRCLGALKCIPGGWAVPPRHLYWVMRMMKEFFETVADYRSTLSKGADWDAGVTRRLFPHTTRELGLEEREQTLPISGH